ncbi:hypothetical protein [Novipirellula aureliae]|nr:hypothetical protein [Novipirellula aureliae]
MTFVEIPVEAGQRSGEVMLWQMTELTEQQYFNIRCSLEPGHFTKAWMPTESLLAHSDLTWKEANEIAAKISSGGLRRGQS